VWTTFHSCQWDLNYQNPAVFDSMLEEMLFLANQGVEVLRFDALAFVWKRLGTNCVNLPENHDLIEAFNAAVGIVAPATLFKAEAVVHPDEVRKYVGPEQCQLAYNAQLMALLWQALAAQDVRALERGLRQRFKLPSGCTWINYIRCHDDICWAISDEDLEAVGLEAAEHRHFLTRFYTGQLGGFACGAPFEGDARTGDARVSGTCASLVGLQKALAEGDQQEIELAIRRILLLYGIIITIGGIPLIYLGDEIGLLNDPAYCQNPAKAEDSRWLHRPAFDWELARQRSDRSAVPGRIYHGLLRLIRTQNPALTNGETEFLETGNRQVFAYCRQQGGHRVFALANFSEREQRLDAPCLGRLGLPELAVDLYAGQTVTPNQDIVMEPYQLMVMSSVKAPACR